MNRDQEISSDVHVKVTKYHYKHGAGFSQVDQCLWPNKDSRKGYNTQGVIIQKQNRLFSESAWLCLLLSDIEE